MNQPNQPNPTPDQTSAPATPEGDAATEGTPVVHGPAGQPKLAQFVTPLKQIEQQVGEHVIASLQHQHTVAILTTVVYGPNGQQNVVSAALDPQMLAEVQKVLQKASTERQPQEPCFGFQCFTEPKSNQGTK